ncbi:branched-chain amino acid ABC transporter permease [uncultured Desulfovibrio sp.]|uniref:ABC transporter permease subunit n=1 Tax=uncultured Desulfovibrio sp. TaxID=167968 RepID=UPI001C3BC44F|nr:branched-chain amino acid ABC transporter permease [uncultured Desulfovibrio sp.]HIX40647.1 branched-chain amino acid ABC transporter permease [Candidatus Desulfovibrio intestinigallinarum]
MNYLGKALLASCWFMLLTLPVMGIRLNSVDQTVEWQLDRVALLGVAIFFLSMLWNWCFSRKARGQAIISLPQSVSGSLKQLFSLPGRNAHTRAVSLGIVLVVMLAMPHVSSFYQTNIMISALLYVMLALGLNIAVGIAGQLVLGYVAFYAVGAYTYALLNQAFGIGFWACLPVGGFMAVLFGLALGFPVLRLRGDYLAIVTLGFGEIVRLTLLNWASLTGGSGGIKDIPAPGFFGMDMDINMSTMFVYYIVLAAVIITIVVISRLKNSRVGLALQALREDEIACEAMGINLARVKLSAFALSSCWAGFAGVIFAAKTSFINPASFTFMESAMILSMVVLGGMGSIVGVVIAAMILILAPEYLRAFSEYRMLIFGAIMVIMMIFRPQGLVTGERRRYRITKLHGNAAKDRA